MAAQWNYTDKWDELTADPILFATYVRPVAFYTMCIVTRTSRADADIGVPDLAGLPHHNNYGIQQLSLPSPRLVIQPAESEPCWKVPLEHEDQLKNVSLAWHSSSNGLVFFSAPARNAI